MDKLLRIGQGLKSELLVAIICSGHNQKGPCRMISQVLQVLEKQKGKQYLVLLQLYCLRVVIDLSKPYTSQAAGKRGSL